MELYTIHSQDDYCTGLFKTEEEAGIELYQMLREEFGSSDIEWMIEAEVEEAFIKLVGGLI